MDTVLNQNIAIPYDEIAAFCQRWGVTEFSLFGSVLRDDFRPDSDIDVLVVLNRSYRLNDLMAMNDELKIIFGRDIDLIMKKVIEQDDNPYRRRLILGTAQVIYHG